ncbi:hypothetical protein SESBI_08031 [Sesbania bispinosa]|nr:hypothetical protein SESBI_08031 [Sesbania bispinosa]
MAHLNPTPYKSETLLYGGSLKGSTTTLMVEQKEIGVLTERQQWRDTTKRAEGQNTFIKVFLQKSITGSS